MGSRLEKNSELVRKRIEAHAFEDEEGDEYEGSKFGGFTDYFRRKKIKLQNRDAQVRSSTSDKPQIFKGVSCHVNGYTQPSLNDLHHLIVSHGGAFMQYLDGKTTVTHIIASNLTPKKAIEFRRYRIVKPAWVVDSIEAGKLLPWNSYKVIDEGVGQRVLAFDDGKVVSQAGTQSRTYRDQTKKSWYTSQIKSVAEDIDGELGAHFPSTQVVASNGTGIYTGSTSHQVQPKKGTPHDKPSGQVTDFQASSASFEVSSSLEDALKDALKDAIANERHADNKTSRMHESPPEEFLDSSEGSEESDLAVTTPQKRFPNETSLESPTPLNSVNNTPHNASHMPTHFESPSPEKPTKSMTAEEHNALLLADPRMRKSSTANPEFLKQYYAESRLHHLSAWKADLKSKCQQMAAERSASQRQSLKRKPGARRYILHVDFDSFFCAVSLKSAPEYVTKPAVVAHGSGTGSEIASCNYPARAFGVKNGMWMKNALELCPDIKVLPYDFPAYEEASRSFYEAILDAGGIIQSVSVDEALVDVSVICLQAGGSDEVGIREGSIWREQEKADEIAEGLRIRIKEKTGCAVSVGIGGNILLAKVALRKAKPAGQYQIKPEEILEFLSDLSVQDLPGVAYSIGGKLEEIGVKFVKDVRQLTKERLISVLGPKTGEKIWDYSRGIDRVEVGEQVVRKSVSAEVNWGIRFISQPEAEEFVQNLCIELQRRLLNERVRGRQLTMKIMRKAADAPLDPPKHLGHGKCDTFNKSIALGMPTNSAEVIGREAISILRGYGFSPGELRGLGVQMTKLEPIKRVDSAFPDGSQRRINFGAAAPKLAKQVTRVDEDPIDDPITPAKRKPLRPSQDDHIDFEIEPISESPTPQKPRAVAPQALHTHDPIHDSPIKARATPVHPAAAIFRANAVDRSANKFLNLTGTQFIVPSQIDPTVLAELPQDIRTKLLAQGGNKTASRNQSPSQKSRSQSPVRQVARAAFNPPLPSQLDPDVFESLPDDLKAEVLASFAAVKHPVSGAQSVLPQSPRKNRTIDNMHLKRLTPTKKRGRGRPRKFDMNSSKTQSSFVAAKRDLFNPVKEADTDAEGYSSETLDPSFLDALPFEMREEILLDHRRPRLVKKSGLMTSSTSLLKKRKPSEVLPIGQRKIRLPPRDPKPTFTTEELSTLPQLRDTLGEWYEEFAGEGPHEEDVRAMERYLKRVVVEERDVAKVVGIVRWVEWLIGEGEEGKGKDAWERALMGVKGEVQGAVRERGLGAVDL
jgi:DNA repair protein REV1